MAVSLTLANITDQKANITEDRGSVIVFLSIFLTAMTSAAIILRLVARTAHRLPYGWDDWFAIAGLVFTALLCVINIVSVHYGLEKKLHATNPKQGNKILEEAGLFLSLIYTLGQWCIKMSILFLYLRIFTARIRWLAITIYVWMAYVNVWAFGVTVAILNVCRPLSYHWQRYNPTLDPPAIGVCSIDLGSFAISASALNTVADFALLSIPVPMLWKLQLSLGRRLALTSVFLVGIFACMASILRLITTFTLTSGTDLAWNTANRFLWTAVEASVGLTCACFPIIWGLFTLLCSKIRSLASPAQESDGFDPSDDSYRRSRTPSKSDDYFSNGSWPRDSGLTETNSLDSMVLEPHESVETEDSQCIGAAFELASVNDEGKLFSANSIQFGADHEDQDHFS